MFVIITEEILLVISLDFYNRIHTNLPIDFFFFIAQTHFFRILMRIIHSFYFAIKISVFFPVMKKTSASFRKCISHY